MVLQPAYLPWLGFFDQMRRADVFVLYDDVQYDKHGWRNRNRIKTQHGPAWLTVPVRHSGLGWPRLDEVVIDNRQPWARKHIASLRQAYARAPFQAALLPALEELLKQPWERLLDLNLATMDLLVRRLGIHTPVRRSSELGIGGDRNERLVRLCQHFGARTYLSGNAAQPYLDVALFEQQGIAVRWHDYEHPVYPQLHGAFVPYLSALDLLLNCGPDSRAVLAGESLAAVTREGNPTVS